MCGKYPIGFIVAIVNVRNWPTTSQPRGKVGICRYIDGDAELVLADISEVIDEKERKKFDIKTMKKEFVAVKTVKTILMGLAMLVCVVILYIPC